MSYDDDLDALAGLEIVGADVAIGARHRAALRADLARARGIDPNAVAAVQQDLTQRRRKVLPPVSNPSIAAGAEAVLTFSTQELFRPERLVWDSTSAPACVITEILVGTRNQQAASGANSAEVFAPTAFDTGVHFDSANIGAQISVRVKNISGAAVVPYPSFIGTSLS